MRTKHLLLFTLNCCLLIGCGADSISSSDSANVSNAVDWAIDIGPEEVAAREHEQAKKCLEIAFIHHEPLTALGDNTRVRVRLKFTAKQQLTRSKVRIVLRDDNFQEVGMESHWVSKIGEHGLEGGESVEEEFIVESTNARSATGVSFSPLVVRGPSIRRVVVVPKPEAPES